MKKVLISVFVVFLFSSLLYGFSLRYVSTIVGNRPGDMFGLVVSSGGDINRDGHPEILVSAMDGGLGGKQPGVVYIFRGRTISTGKPYTSISQDEPADRFGSAMCPLGDINGDGYDDFAVAADRSDATGTDAGAVYIYLGGEEDPILYKKLSGERANDWFGTSVAGGADITGDGKSDLVVGASYGGDNYSGAVYIFSGAQEFEEPVVLEKGEPGSLFGHRVRIVGDITGDGINDLAIGAYYTTHSGRKYCGAVYIFAGGEKISSAPFATFFGRQEKDWFGFDVVGLGDVNKDGFADFAVGAPRAGKKREGRVYLYYGGKSIPDKPAIVFGGKETGDMFGYSLSAGDIDGDKLPELICGAPGYDTGNYRSGRAFIFSLSYPLDAISDHHINGEAADDECGKFISFIDGVFGKGKGALFLSAPGVEGRKEVISKLFIYR
ncbi:FG-GAP repeat protein [bacterium]|nr:FG-GAP repeat protein [bacterium]